MRHAVALALLLGAVALPARAGLFDDAEARKQIDQLRDEVRSKYTEHDGRVLKLEAAARGQIELQNQIEALRAELARLRGQLEVVTNDLEQAQKRQRDFYVDLDTRLRKLETPVIADAAQSAPAAAASAPPPVDTAAETHDYEAALNLFRAGKAKEAAAGFLAFIKAYPQSNFLPSAQFWAANALYDTHEVARAADLYGKVAEGAPDDPRAPDALLGLSNCQLTLGDKKGARASLEKILAKYSSSPAAQTAKQRLGKK